MALQASRRTRLADWLKANGGPRAVCLRRGLKKSTESYISQLLSGETFGQKAARNMEFKLGMDAGYLDDAGETAATSLSPQALALGQLFDELTDRVDRARAWNAASAEILRVIRQPASAPAAQQVPAETLQRSRNSPQR